MRVLKTTAATLALAGVALAGTSNVASAAPIRECGDMYDVNVENLTVRSVNCRTARWFVVDYQRSGRVPHYAGYPRRMRLLFKRTERIHGYSVQDIRFSNGRQVIRYQQNVIDD